MFPLYDLTRRIAGPDADVVIAAAPLAATPTRIPAPAARGDTASVQATSEQLARSRLAVMVGLGLDSWLEELVSSASATPSGQAANRPATRVLRIGDRVPTIAQSNQSASGAPAEPSPTEQPDPFVWLDPTRARLIVRAIAEELSRVAPAHAADFRQRATTCDTALTQLDAAIEIRVRHLPARDFVVAQSPSGFAYFADRYKLELKANNTTRTGPSARTVALDPFGVSPDAVSYEALLGLAMQRLEQSAAGVDTP